MSDQPFNLFDLSASSSKKKIIRKEAGSVEKKPVIAPSSGEAGNLLKKMKKMHTELTEQMEQVFQKSGQNPSSLESYFSNPSNFTPEEWQALQARKAEIESKILGENYIASQLKKKKKQEGKLAKGRKGKTLGARKRWLDMR